jgi:hypothetical protein
MSNVQTTSAPMAEVLLTPQQEAYITYLACGGMIPSEDGGMPATKCTAEQFARNHLGVSRETLYYWRKTIPDLWDRVQQRRKEIGGKDRLSHAWNGIFLATCKGDARSGELYFRHFDPDYKPANFKPTDDTPTGFMDLLQRFREVNAQTTKPTVIEAEVTTHDTNQTQTR